MSVVTVLQEILNERDRQDRKWGEQNHPNGTGSHSRELADQARDECDDAFKAGQGTWRHVLLEEVYEAFAESDPRRLREELVQVAAVATAWVEAIDRRTK